MDSWLQEETCTYSFATQDTEYQTGVSGSETTQWWLERQAQLTCMIFH